MWPFGRGRHRACLADGATYAALFDLWARAEHRETASTYQLGYLRAGPGARRRGRPPLPLLQLLPEPGGSIDFADPLTGFRGLERPPAAERLLTIWADDLVSVHHGDRWIFVVDSAEPLSLGWLDLVGRRAAGGVRRPYCVVTAAFAGPIRPGAFRVSDLDAATYTTLVHVDDRRGRRGAGTAGRQASGRSQ